VPRNPLPRVFIYSGGNMAPKYNISRVSKKKISQKKVIIFKILFSYIVLKWAIFSKKKKRRRIKKRKWEVISGWVNTLLESVRVSHVSSSDLLNFRDFHWILPHGRIFSIFRINYFLEVSEIFFVYIFLISWENVPVSVMKTVFLCALNGRICAYIRSVLKMDF